MKKNNIEQKIKQEFAFPKFKEKLYELLKNEENEEKTDVIYLSIFLIEVIELESKLRDIINKHQNITLGKLIHELKKTFNEYIKKQKITNHIVKTLFKKENVDFYFKKLKDINRLRNDIIHNFLKPNNEKTISRIIDQIKNVYCYEKPNFSLEREIEYFLSKNYKIEEILNYKKSIKNFKKSQLSLILVITNFYLKEIIKN